MSQLSMDTMLVIPEDVIFRELDGEAIILNLATGMYFGLDEVGTRAWALVTESGSLRRAADVLVMEFDVERPALEGDLLELTARLIDKGLIAPRT